uniref:Uncharacterized protein n=1 Tax=Populus trichocarpa TaxID=3694 RepID=A0A3N7FF64_POPTR
MQSCLGTAYVQIQIFSRLWCSVMFCCTGLSYTWSRVQYGHPSCDEFIGLLRNHVFRSICSPLNVIAFFCSQHITFWINYI